MDTFQNNFFKCIRYLNSSFPIGSFNYNISTLIFLLGVVLFVGFRSDQTSIDTEQLILRNNNGRIMATLEAYSGYPRLTMFDSYGQKRILISVPPDGASLNLQNGNGSTKISIADMNDGRSVISFFDNSGRVIYRLPQ